MARDVLVLTGPAGDHPAHPFSLELHPDWCETLNSGGAGCGQHLSQPTIIPATAGSHVVGSFAIEYPYLDIRATLDATGTRRVLIVGKDPGQDGADISVPIGTTTAQSLAAALVRGSAAALVGDQNYCGMPTAMAVEPTRDATAVALTAGLAGMTAVLTRAETVALAEALSATVATLNHPTRMLTWAGRHA